MSRKRTRASAPCGIAMSDCTEAVCAEYATCQKRVSASVAPCGRAMSDCNDACDEYHTCQKRVSASLAACGLAMSDCTDACDKYATCQKRVSASIGACGVAVSDCAEVACCKTGICQQAMAYTLNWGPRQPTLVEELNWVGVASVAACGLALSDCTDAACAKYATCQKKVTGRFITRKELLSFGDSTEARPCTEGDDDSQYGPRGDDQKCTDEGRGGQRSVDDGDNTVEEQGYPGQFSDDYDGGYDDEPAGDVPEGYQEVDTGDPSLDPEGGDWESLLDEGVDEGVDLKKTLKEEDRFAKEEQKVQETTDKKQSRTSIRIPRDPSLTPESYHQFWSHENPTWAIQQAVKILEDRVGNPRTPEDSEAARSLLMNGPKAGGAYQKTKKADPGEPGAEDFIDREDKSPII